MSIKVLLADDHKIVREGLRSLLGKQSDIDVVAEAENGAETLEKARKIKPNVIVMDIGMPDMNGIEATRRITTECPHINVIALSIHHDKRYVAEMFRAGAAGFLPKDSAFDELIRAIHEVVARRTYLSPKVAGLVVDDYVSHLDSEQDTAYSILTSREREVLQRIAEGRSTKEIAGALNVSVKTVESFRKQLMKKLKIFNVAELTKYAIRAGITSV